MSLHELLEHLPDWDHPVDLLQIHVPWDTSADLRLCADSERVDRTGKTWRHWPFSVQVPELGADLDDGFTVTGPPLEGLRQLLELSPQGSDAVGLFWYRCPASAWVSWPPQDVRAHVGIYRESTIAVDEVTILTRGVLRLAAPVGAYYRIPEWAPVLAWEYGWGAKHKRIPFPRHTLAGSAPDPTPAQGADSPEPPAETVDAPKGKR